MLPTLRILGNCGIQTPEFETTSFCLELEKETLLVDCGPGIPRQLQVAGLDLARITTIVVTHMHGDHVAGLPYLLFLLSQRASRSGQESTVNVYAPPEVVLGVEQLTALQYPSGLRNLKVGYRELSYDAPIEGLEFSLSAREAVHSVPAAGIRIETHNTSIAYSGDTLPDQRFIELARGVDLLLYEAFGVEDDRETATRAGHSVAVDAGKIATAASVSRLALMHPLPKYRHNPNVLIDEASRYFSGSISVPNELDILEK